MAQVASAETKRGSRARRWCARAVLVVGGTVLGTAAAWAVSTAGASAHTTSSDDSRSVVSEHRSGESDRPLASARDFMNDPAHFLREGAEAAVDEMRTGDEPHKTTPENGADAGTAEVREALSSLEPADGDADSGDADANQARQVVEESAARVCAETASLFEGLLAGSDDDAFDKDQWKHRLEEWFAPGFEDIVEMPEAPGVPGLPGAAAPAAPSTFVPGPAADAAAPVSTPVTERGTSERDASLDAVRHTSPELPSDGTPLQLPLGAPTAPFTQNGGHAGHGNADGSTVGATFASGNAPSALPVDAALCGTDRVPFEPGRQPGVTPD